ncbi:hypothetical protein [Acidovorax sp. SUPP3334]|nr:hypothetical protein [Acidovorax sp. SUPP3334]GKT25213.1 hypothetical protein AVHM3334_17265 [Acidovorax sp. SUPP3334]
MTVVTIFRTGIAMAKSGARNGRWLGPRTAESSMKKTQKNHD